MGTKPVCVGHSFGCVNGDCFEVEEQTAKCACQDQYTGDTCDEPDFDWYLKGRKKGRKKLKERNERKMRTNLNSRRILYIISFVVGCLVILLVVIIIIVRLHRKREPYQPLMR